MTPCKHYPIDQPIDRYRAASEANDLEGIMTELDPEIELVSPLSGRMVFRGTDDIRVLLGAVYGTLHDLHWREIVGDGNVRVLVGDARVGPLKLTDAMVCELAADGRIRRLRPHLRPWLALTLFAFLLGPKVGRRPGVSLRALRR